MGFISEGQLMLARVKKNMEIIFLGVVANQQRERHTAGQEESVKYRVIPVLNLRGLITTQTVYGKAGSKCENNQAGIYLATMGTLLETPNLFKVNDKDTSNAQKMKSSIKDFFSKCDQICRKLLADILFLLDHNYSRCLKQNFKD